MVIELLPDGLWEPVEPFYPGRQGETQGRKTALSGQDMSHGQRSAQWYSFLHRATLTTGPNLRHDLRRK